MAKILYVSHRTNLSGAPRSLLLLAREMRNRGHRVVFSAPRDGPLLSDCDDPGLETFFARGKGMTKYLFTRNLCRFIGRNRFDIVHVNTYQAAYGAAAARRFKLPLVWHIRENVEDIPRYWTRKIGRLADVVIVPSRELGNRILEHRVVSEDRLRVIANGIDVDMTGQGAAALPGDTRGKLKIPTDSVVIGMVGTVKPRKGVEYFIRAAGMTAAKKNRARFLLIGDPFPGKEKYYREMGQLRRVLGLEQKMFFLGATTEVLNLIRCMDVLVLPSLWEGMSRVILEAMALARPVIAADVGGNRELVANGSTGILVKPASAEDLSRSIMALYENREEREEMGRRGEKRVREHFSLQKHCDRVDEVYREWVGPC